MKQGYYNTCCGNLQRGIWQNHKSDGKNSKRHLLHGKNGYNTITNAICHIAKMAVAKLRQSKDKVLFRKHLSQFDKAAVKYIDLCNVFFPVDLIRIKQAVF